MIELLAPLVLVAVSAAYVRRSATLAARGPNSGQRLSKPVGRHRRRLGASSIDVRLSGSPSVEADGTRANAPKGPNDSYHPGDR